MISQRDDIPARVVLDFEPGIDAFCDESVPVHPEISKDSSVSKWGLSSVPSWVDSELSKSSVGGKHRWDKKGTMVHMIQAQRVGDLSLECMTALRAKRNDIQASDVRRKEFLKGLKTNSKPGAGLTKLTLPKLDLHSIDPQRPTAAQSSRVDWERSEDSWQDSLWSEGAFSERSLRSIVTDRDARKRWLYDTQELSKEHSLEPFVTNSAPPIPPKLLKGTDLDKEALAVRVESKRISRMLHGVNVDVIKRPGKSNTGKGDKLPNRSQQLKNLQIDLQHVNASVKSVAYSLGAPLERPARHDYVKANKYSVDHSRQQVVGARRLRQSIEFQDKIEAVLVRNAEKQIEKCNDIARILRRRERRQYKTQMADLADALERSQQTWLAARAIAHFTSLLSTELADRRAERTRMAMTIQRFWRLYWQRMGRKKVQALAKITRWVRRHIGHFRSKRRAKAIHKVRTFVNEMKDVVLVLPSIRRFKRRVLLIQRQVRAHLEGTRAVRKKLVAHFDQQQKHVIFQLVREKVIKDREQEGAAEAPRSDALSRTSSATTSQQRQRRRSVSTSEEAAMDWNKMFDEMYRFRVGAAVKDSMVTGIVRRKRQQFSHKRQKWKDEMREYKASFRTSTLFRAQIQEFLELTGQEEQYMDDLESIAGTNQSLLRMIKSMNKKLPVYPVFRDTVSDERMKHVVYQALFLAARSSYNIRRLMEGVQEPVFLSSPPPQVQISRLPSTQAES